MRIIRSRLTGWSVSFKDKGEESDILSPDVYLVMLAVASSLPIFKVTEVWRATLYTLLILIVLFYMRRMVPPRYSTDQGAIFLLIPFAAWFALSYGIAYQMAFTQ